jgi:hypothetical protein
MESPSHQLGKMGRTLGPWMSLAFRTTAMASLGRSYYEGNGAMDRMTYEDRPFRAFSDAERAGRPAFPWLGRRFGWEIR